ncbi:MAG: dihydropteroate synthase [Deltaproteobacteria bacterium]|nr:MAG: dihydropteroate synthase [Deltaproteobacteria bacterium]
MKLIGENINVVSKRFAEAFKNKDPRPIIEEVKYQKEKGMDWIDINIGPARKNGPELMEWIVKTIEEEVPDHPPLSLDTSNIEAMEAGLAAHKSGRALINSIMCRPERYEKMIPLAVKYNAQVIALMWGPEGLPRDENERAALCAELIYAMNEAGIKNEDIFVDGIVTPLNIQQQQLMSLLAFMDMLQDIAPGVKSTCGLSNISNGVPTHLRPIINQTYMIMLQRKGMYSCIADAHDDGLIAIARGERPDIVELVYKVMDGEEIDINSLPENPNHGWKLADYVKTAKVILGHTLFSDSWLEV